MLSRFASSRILLAARHKVGAEKYLWYHKLANTQVSISVRRSSVSAVCRTLARFVTIGTCDAMRSRRCNCSSSDSAVGSFRRRVFEGTGNRIQSSS
jgi:hypothetical protein